VLGELVAEYLVETPRLLADLQGAGADARRIVRAAHDLKSTSATLGACGLAAAAGQVEAAAQGGAAPPAGMIEGLALEFARVRAALAGAGGELTVYSR
jgi:HPt (histidine-containing phosphotransfer) domain-containing protein